MISRDRQYRSFEVRAKEDGEKRIVEGYAARFEIPAVLYELDGVKYSEIIRKGAFEKAEMRDVVMNYNHEGKPVARTKNGTLKLDVDENGLRVWADLGGTEEGRRLYDEIRGGYIDKMSFAFLTEKDNFIRETRTREILEFKRIFDVAAVDIPAYDDTNISARSYFFAEAEKEAAEAVRLRAKKLKIKILSEV